jgi:hypothetical protein
MLPRPERIPEDSAKSLRTSCALQVDDSEGFVPEVLRHLQFKRIALSGSIPVARSTIP